MKAIKIIAVVFGAVLITSLAIDASDTFSGDSGTMLSQIIGSSGDICPKGMIAVPAAQTFSCVDEYEAVSINCPVGNPTNQFDTEINLADSGCMVESNEMGIPWRFVDREQAEILCARSGKRLPDAEEWYRFALGTPTNKCNVNQGGVVVGADLPECVSAAGVKNAVGNVWEWVKDDVAGGVYENRELPETGYVVQVDSSGVATKTGLEKVDGETKEDYFWSSKEGSHGMIRGGFYGSRADAGVFSIHAATLPTFSGAGVGFRCIL